MGNLSYNIIERFILKITVSLTFWYFQKYYFIFSRLKKDPSKKVEHKENKKQSSN